MPRPGKFIEIGKVAYAVSGPAKGKLCVIVDIIDQNRALVEGPFTGVRRQEYQINRLQITKLKIKIQHSQRSKFVKQAWRDAKIDVLWNDCTLAKNLRNKRLRNNLTDFDKFKVGFLKQTRNRLVREVCEDMNKKVIKRKSLNPDIRNYYLKQEAIRLAKRSAQIKKHGSEAKYEKFLKEEVPKLKKQFKAKVATVKSGETKQLKEELSKTGSNRDLREKALSKYALNLCNMVRFNREGKMVLRDAVPKDINVLPYEERAILRKAKGKYIKDRDLKIKEAARLKKKMQRKKLAAAKRSPWAKKVSAK